MVNVAITKVYGRLIPPPHLTTTASILPGERLGVEDDCDTRDGQDGRGKPSSSIARQQIVVAATHMSGLPEGAGAKADSCAA